MQKTKSIILVIILALALASAAVPLFPMVSAATPAITLTPASQVPGGSITISGTGFGAIQAVGIGFGAEVQVTNEWMTISGPFDFGNGPYTGFTARLPVKPTTFRISINISSTTWFQTASDVAGNGTLNNGLPTGNVTLNYVTGNWTRFTTSPVASSPYYKHVCNYTSYEYIVTPVAGVSTNSSGAFTASITVPRIYNGTHTVTVIDSQGNKATAVLTVTGSAVTPPAGWSKTYGGANDEALAYPNVIQTSDGGFLMTADTNSYGAGGKDAWLVKTDSAGNIQWSKTCGGPLDETAAMICKTSDGGYAVIATTKSYGAGDNDFWLLKIDAAGNLQWNKTYGGSGDDTGYDIRQTADGGYALLGYTTSFGAGGQDVWIIKTDGSGNMQWNKTFGTTGAEQGGNIILTADGGYALPSYMSSGGFKSWLIKLDQSGNMVWNKTYTLGTISYAYIGTPTTDGGYALTGVTYIGGNADFWFIKTDSSGNMLWNRTYGGSSTDTAVGMKRTSDGGYAIVGRTYSFGAGGSDLWLVKTDAAGGGLPQPPAASAFSSVSVLPGWTWYFFVHSNGGVGAHKYQWYDASGPLAGQTSMVLPVTKTVPGTYTFYCQVTDSQGTSANSNSVILTVIS